MRCQHVFESHTYLRWVRSNLAFFRRRGSSTVARLARHNLPSRLTRACTEVSDALPSYSVCTIASIRVRFTADFGALLLPLHTYSPDGAAYAYLADLSIIRAIGSKAQPSPVPPHGLVVIVVEVLVAYRWFDSFVTAAEHWDCRFRSGNLGLARVFIYLCVSPL